MPDPQRGYVELAIDNPLKAESKPPQPPRLLACLTGGYMRLCVLLWAAYMMTVLTVTWYDVTWYHVVGQDIEDDEGPWGQIYDATRAVSKSGITVASAASEAAAGNKVGLGLRDEEFDIMEDDFEQPTGWYAGIIHGWMVTVTTLNGFIALTVWFIFFKNVLVTVCGIKRFDANQALREHRQELACDVALLYQLFVPFMTWLIEKLTGYKDCGIAHLLYHRMMAIGPLVLIGQKLLVFLMRTLRDAQEAMNSSGDVAWTLCSKDDKDKVKSVQCCAIEIFEKSHVLNLGPMYFQRLVGGGMMAAVFQNRPYGLVLGILGVVDKMIVGPLAMKILGVIPSWIDDDIDKMEAKLASIGAEATKLNKELDDHLRRVKDVIDKAKLLLIEAQDHLAHAREITAKEHVLLGKSMTWQMEKTIDKVSTPLAALQKDVSFADDEITQIEKSIETEANKEVAKIVETIMSLTKKLDCLRPENVMKRLEDLADNALYGEVVGVMADSKKKGASPLEFEPEGPPSAAVS